MHQDFSEDSAADAQTCHLPISLTPEQVHDVEVWIKLASELLVRCRLCPLYFI